VTNPSPDAYILLDTPVHPHTGGEESAMDLAAPMPSRPARRAPRSRSARRALAVLGALVPLLLVAGPVAAAPPGPAAAPVAATGDRPESATAAARQPATATPHCALIAGAGQTLHCFATFRAAIAYGTHGRIADAPVSAAAAARDPGFAAKVDAAVAPAASSLLGTEYADANFRGGSVNFFGSGGCDNSSDADFRFPSMPAGWNDRITSFTSASNCAQQLFRNTNFGGGSLTIVIRSLANVGSAANDAASSLTFN
jgi:hypothetical protein